MARGERRGGSAHVMMRQQVEEGEARAAQIEIDIPKKRPVDIGLDERYFDKDALNVPEKRARAFEDGDLAALDVELDEVDAIDAGIAGPARHVRDLLLDRPVLEEHLPSQGKLARVLKFPAVRYGTVLA